MKQAIFISYYSNFFITQFAYYIHDESIDWLLNKPSVKGKKTDNCSLKPIGKSSNWQNQVFPFSISEIKAANPQN